MYRVNSQCIFLTIFFLLTAEKQGGKNLKFSLFDFTTVYDVKPRSTTHRMREIPLTARVWNKILCTEAILQIHK